MKVSVKHVFLPRSPFFPDKIRVSTGRRAVAMVTGVLVGALMEIAAINSSCLQLHLFEGELHANINGDGVLDHVQVHDIYTSSLVVIIISPRGRVLASIKLSSQPTHALITDDFSNEM